MTKEQAWEVVRELAEHLANTERSGHSEMNFRVTDHIKPTEAKVLAMAAKAAEALRVVLECPDCEGSKEDHPDYTQPCGYCAGTGLGI